MVAYWVVWMAELLAALLVKHWAGLKGKQPVDNLDEWLGWPVVVMKA
jgi:hypothetical protein